MRKNSFSDFNRLAQAVLAYRSSKALLVALHYDLFTWIEKDGATPERLAVKLRLNPRALRILMGALASMGFLEKSGRAYRNAPFARKMLVAGRPDYKGNNLKYQERTWAAWSDLSRVLKTGAPRKTLLGWLHKDVFTRDYINAMEDIARKPAEELASKLDWRGVERTLDVGCGPGTYSAAFVRLTPQIEATLFDLPRTLRVAKARLAGPRGRGRFIFKPGDYLRDGFGRREYDLILISHVTHNESPSTNSALARKAYAALRPGGRLVVHDFLLDPGRDGPEFSALFALHMLVFTGEGNVYTFGDYAGWLRRAGFRAIRSLPLARASATPSFAIVGRKN